MQYFQLKYNASLNVSDLNASQKIKEPFVTINGILHLLSTLTACAIIPWNKIKALKHALEKQSFPLFFCV